MRKLRITEHISLDGVIQHSADENDFPYSDWTARLIGPLLAEMRSSASGVIFSIYEPNGPLRTGTMGA